MGSSDENEATRLAALLSRLRDEGECEVTSVARPKELSHFRRNRALALHTVCRAYSRAIRSTGLWRNNEDLASINRKPRKRITRLAIRSYWAECWGATRMLWISNFSGDGIDLELHEVWDLSAAYIGKIRPNAVCYMKQHYLSLLESDNLT